MPGHGDAARRNEQRHKAFEDAVTAFARMSHHEMIEQVEGGRSSLRGVLKPSPESAKDLIELSARLSDCIKFAANSSWSEKGRVEIRWETESPYVIRRVMEEYARARVDGRQSYKPRGSFKRLDQDEIKQREEAEMAALAANTSYLEEAIF